MNLNLNSDASYLKEEITFYVFAQADQALSPSVNNLTIKKFTPLHLCHSLNSCKISEVMLWSFTQDYYFQLKFSVVGL